MNGIYIVDMTTFNFLLQATPVLQVGNYDEDELRMVYDFIISLDYDILNEYLSGCTILSYDNDLELYIEIIDSLILIFEEREEYEKCQILKNKKDEAIEIMQN